jgi:pimeloyl-ACP methyl ester carboxylesterase
MSSKGLRLSLELSRKALKLGFKTHNDPLKKLVQRPLHSQSVMNQKHSRVIYTNIPEIVRRNHPNDYPNYRRMATTPEGPSKSQFLTHLPHTERQFPTSWGNIAAKEYGNPGGHGVLCVHGWLDNAGSFDPVIPYILAEHKKFHVLAMDEPGCGLSSHKPVGSEYGRWSTLKEMKRVIDAMGWNDVTVIGHSLGGNYALLFGSIYPELVRRVVSIDVAKPLTFVSESWVHRVPKAIDMHLRYDEKYMKDPTLESSAPIYSEPDALKRMTESHGHSLTEDSARILMKRGSKKMKWGVTFTRDIRHNLPPFDPSPSEEAMLNFVSRMRCDLLVIRAKQGPYHVAEKVRKQFYDTYERNCRMFRDVLMDGSHHLHMNNPDKVGTVINDFITDSIELGPMFNRSKSNL